MNLCQHGKKQAISLICSGDIDDKKNLAIWLTESVLAHISGTRAFPNKGFVQKHRNSY